MDQCTPLDTALILLGAALQMLRHAKSAQAIIHNNGNVAPYLVMDETAEPRSRRPSKSIEQDERSKDSSISLSLKKSAARERL